MIENIKKIGVALKILTNKRATVEYPENKEILPDNYRGMLRLDIDTCISCGACARICPNSTITMVDRDTDRGIKKYPEVNLERCFFCGLCEEVCPPKCLVLTKSYTEVVSFDRREFIKEPEELN